MTGSCFASPADQLKKLNARQPPGDLLLLPNKKVNIRRHSAATYIQDP